jgi:hypothetical protein
MSTTMMSLKEKQLVGRGRHLPSPHPGQPFPD